MKPIPLLVPASGVPTDEVLRDVRDAVHRRSGVLLAPVHVPSAALLPRVFEELRDALAWTPAFVGSALVRSELAAPLAAITRTGRRARSAVLVASRAIEGLADLAGRRIGWVSRSSATGYVVPRLYLASFGVEVADLFAHERLCGSHEEAAAALARCDVDVIATHSGHVEALFARLPIRVVASIGPIPADLVVAGPLVTPAVREAIAHALSSVSAGPHAFAPARPGHLALFDLLQRQARDLREAPAPSGDAALTSWGR